ncbi:MAG TPA: hypothetical protein EYM73_08345 [Dehalococcoidia bacterium]|nr:hypothetical protein [Dehalococcoidia bacterium]
MSNIVTMECSLGHRWILPLRGTSYVVFPPQCPKCIKVPNKTIAATVTFPDNGSPSVVIERQ